MQFCKIVATAMLLPAFKTRCQPQSIATEVGNDFSLWRTRG